MVVYIFVFLDVVMCSFLVLSKWLIMQEVWVLGISFLKWVYDLALTSTFIPTQLNSNFLFIDYITVYPCTCLFVCSLFCSIYYFVCRFL